MVKVTKKPTRIPMHTEKKRTRRPGKNRKPFPKRMREGLNTLATGFKALRCPQEKTLRGNLSKWFGGATMAINCIGKDGKAKVDYSKDINIVKSPGNKLLA